MCFAMTCLASGLSIHGQQWWGSISGLGGVLLSMVEGFPKVLGFGGTRGCMYVSVREVRDI